MRVPAVLLWQRLVRIRESQAAWFLFAAGLLFLGISIAVRMQQVDRLDLQVTHFVQRLATPTWTVVASFLSFLGNTLTLCVLAGIAACVLFLMERRVAALLTLLTLLGLPLNMLLKGVVERPRPDANLVEVLLPRIGLSYPSGHSMASTMFFGYLALLVWLHAWPGTRRRVAMTALIGALPVLISLSRIYVGAHWLSDVVGGMTAGTFFLLILGQVYKTYEKVERKADEKVVETMAQKSELPHFEREQATS